MTTRPIQPSFGCLWQKWLWNKVGFYSSKTHSGVCVWCCN